MPQSNEIESVVIVGGGTAGWMAAASFARFLNDGKRKITLVESEEIGTIGVGEATIPPIMAFNQLLGIDENEFLRATQGTVKLGIEFVNWGKKGDSYIHPFGDFGEDIHGINFHQLWLREYLRGNQVPIGDFSISVAAAKLGRFARPAANAPAPLNKLRYAFHFDAGLYAKFLRNYAEKLGVTRREGRITAVHRRESGQQQGFIESVQLADGSRIAGDLFIDCSGFTGLLIDKEMGSAFDDWSHWLPMDRAVAVPTANIASPVPYTRSTAHGAGWQWRIPLQHRTGNGHVYSSQYVSDDEATATLLAHVEGPTLADPRQIKFKTGKRKEAWRGNVVAIGLASGFVEPLESTAIHLIQNGIARLLALFPDKSCAAQERDEYNRGMSTLYEDIRDFIILHYKATQRDDTPFWRRCRDLDVPESLANRMELFLSRGRVFRENSELFTMPSWVAVMVGQNMWPRRYEPLADTLDENRVAEAMAALRTDIAKMAHALPTQEDFLRRAGAWAADDERPFARALATASA